MNITLFYFSGTGNTWWAAKEITRELGDTCRMYSVENEKLKDRSFLTSLLNESDHLIFAYPVYSSRMPDPIHEFINSLPERETTASSSIVATKAGASGDAAYYNARRLAKKGYPIKQTLHLLMGNNYYLPHLKTSPTRDEEHKRELREGVLRDIIPFCEAILSGTKWLHNAELLKKTGGAIMRAFYRPCIWLAQISLYAEPSRCNQCGLCVDNCPTGNIHLTDKSVIFEKNCVSCMRCYNFCPKDAVLFGKKTLDSDIWYRYKGPEKLSLKEIQK